MHALLEDLDDWVRKGIPPPPSRYPRIADGTLVPPSKLAAKTIEFPDVYEPYKLDFGPEWTRGIIAEPPRLLGAYPALVPQVGEDGNEIAGVRLPRITVPLATYTGWNFRSANIGFPQSRVSFLGSYLPLSQVAYRDKADYMGRYAMAALKLIDERFLSAAELDAMLRRGAEEWDVATAGKRP
jgi:hypothetical protein